MLSNKDISTISKCMPKKINKFIDLNSIPKLEKSFYLHNKPNKWLLNCTTREKYYSWKYIYSYPHIIIKNIEELEQKNIIYDVEMVKVMNNLKECNSIKSLFKYRQGIYEISDYMNKTNGLITHYQLMDCINLIEPNDMVFLDARFMINSNARNNMKFITQRIDEKNGYYCFLTNDDIDFKSYNAQYTLDKLGFITNY